MQHRQNLIFRECSMTIAVFFALQERNVYNRRCQPPEKKPNKTKAPMGRNKQSDGSYAPTGLTRSVECRIRRLLRY